MARKKAGSRKGTLSDVEARDWYKARVAEIDVIEQWLRAQGKTAKEIFETTTRLRNTAKRRARELMKNRVLAKSLPPIKTPEEILAKYGGNYERAIAAARRTNPEVNRMIEEQRRESEKPK